MWAGGWAVPSTAEAQDGVRPRAARVVEWAAGDGPGLSAALGVSLAGAGYQVDPDGAVTAARAFAGTSGPLDEPTARALRDAMRVQVLVWVSVREQAGTSLWALRLFFANETVSDFGASIPAAVANAVDSALRRRLAAVTASSGPASSGLASSGLASSGLASSGPAPSGPAPSGPAPSGPAAPFWSSGTPRVTGPDAPSPQPSASNAIAPVFPSSRVAADPSTSSGAADADRPSVAPLGASTADSAPHAAALSADVGSSSGTADVSAGATSGDDATVAEIPEPRTARSMRVRVALVGFAGIEGYGYGGGLRVEVPLAQAGGGDNSFCLGFDIGVAYDQLGLDERNAWHALQIPGAVYFSWRFDFGALQIAPRVGVAGAARLAWLEGGNASGERQDLLAMVIAGLSIAPWVGDAQLFFAADLTVGPRVGFLLTAGVAL